MFGGAAPVPPTYTMPPMPVAVGCHGLLESWSGQLGFDALRLASLQPISPHRHCASVQLWLPLLADTHCIIALDKHTHTHAQILVYTRTQNNLEYTNMSKFYQKGQSLLGRKTKQRDMKKGLI